MMILLKLQCAVAIFSATTLLPLKADVNVDSTSSNDIVKESETVLPLKTDPDAGVATDKGKAKEKYRFSWTPSSWIVTATTVDHSKTKKFDDSDEDDSPKMMIVGGARPYSPYVHWTCFHQSPQPRVSSKDKLFCCQNIYDQMKISSLCYKKDKCDEKHHRTQFLRLCAAQIAAVPRFVSGSGEDDDNETKKSERFYPQLTLFIGEQDPKHFHKVDLGEDAFRQSIWIRPVPIEHQGRSLQGIPLSPLHLAIDNKTLPEYLWPLVAAPQDGEQNPLIAVLKTSVVGAGDGSDTYSAERILEHNLTLHLESDRISRNSEWKATLQILLFIPVNLILSSSKNALSPCTSNTTTTACQVARRNSSEKSSPSLQEAHPLTISIQGKTTDENELVTINWTTKVEMDDEEEDLVIPAPVILDGKLEAASPGGGDVVTFHYHAQSSELSSLSSYHPPLTTLLEGSLRDEL